MFDRIAEFFSDHKNLFDSAAAGIAFGAVFDMLPKVAALLSIIWTMTRLYEYFKIKFRKYSKPQVKIELIDDFHNFRRFLSVKLSAIGAILTTALIQFPEIWAGLPGFVTAMIPAKYSPLIGVLFVVAGIIGRGIKQKELHNGTQSASQD